MSFEESRQTKANVAAMTLPKIDTSRPRRAKTNPPLPPLRFGLRSFLIAITVLGVAIGLLGRLWNRNPEWVLAILKFSPIILMALLLFFVFRLRNSRHSAAGYVPLLIFPIASSLYFARIDSLRLLPTKHLVERRLIQNADDSAVWKELERRVLDQKLSAKETDHLVETLIVGGRLAPAGKSPGENTPLLHRSMFARNFIDIAVQRELISDENLVAIADQHYSPPRAKQLRLREGHNRVGLHFVDFGTGSFGCPVQLVWNVASVDLDGNEVEVKQGGNYPVGRVEESDFSVGDRKLNVHLVCGYVPRGSIGGTWHGVSEQKKWPKTLKEWETTVTIPLRVYAEDHEIVKLIEDEARDPSEFVKVVGVFFQGASQDGTSPARISVKTKRKPLPEIPVAMCYDIFLVTETDRIKAGKYLAYHDENGQLVAACNSEVLEQPVASLPKKADLEFVPNPRNKILELATEVTEIWGKTIVIKDCDVKPLPRPNVGPPPPPVVDPNA